MPACYNGYFKIAFIDVGRNKYVLMFSALILFFLKSIVAYGQAPHISYVTPQTYTINQTIAPLSPSNTGGAVPVGRLGQVSTFAGSGTGGYKDGIGKAASFSTPIGLALDKSGNLYVCDSFNNMIRKIAPSGLVSTFAGSGLKGFVNGKGILASFNFPTGLTIDASGNLYVADSGNDLIRMITPSGVVSTFAGSGNQASEDGTGVLASFNSPYGLTIDAENNIFVVDVWGQAIRMISPQGVVSTFAGSSVGGYVNGPGAVAKFDGPVDIAIDNKGNLFVTDEANACVRMISSSDIVSTFAGNGATGPLASLFVQGGIATDNSGNVFIIDDELNQIEKISAAGVYSVIAGNGSRGSADGFGTAASFNVPQNAISDNLGNLYVADVGNDDIRKISLAGYFINKPLPPGLTFDSTTGAISGTPTATSPSTDYTVTANNANGSSSTIVNIQIVNDALKPSIITFPPPILVLGPNNDYDPHATSTNNETPIIYTSSNPAVATIDVNGLVHVIGPGVSIITATQAGDANYSPAQPVTEILTVTESQEITFPVIEAKTTCDVDFSVNATSTNLTIPLTYNSNNPSVATISSTGIVHIIGAGSTTITVSQAGNNLYTPAMPQLQVLTITPGVIPLASIAVNYQGVCTGSPVAFTATPINGGANLVYQWQVNGVNVGTNSSIYTTTAIAHTDAVQCILTNPGTCNLAGASNIITGVSTVPYTGVSISITSSAPNPICSGDEVTFRAFPSNPGNAPKYQWKINGINTGPNNSVFSTTALKNNDLVTCVFTNTDNDPCMVDPTGASNIVQMIVLPSVPTNFSVSIAADNSSVCTGIPVTFTAMPNNAGVNPIYQWQVNGVNTGSNSPTFASNTFDNGDVVTCALTNLGGACLAASTTYSNSIKLNITPVSNLVPSVTVTPYAFGGCAGMTFIYTANATNAGNKPIYQWTVNGQDAGTNAVTFTSSTLVTGDQIICKVISSIPCSVATATSNTATLTADPYKINAVIITSTAINNIISPGEQVTFTAKSALAATGVTSFEYQWQVNNVDVGSSSPVFTTTGLKNNDVITCILATSGECIGTPFVISNPIEIVVVTPVIVVNTFTPNGDGVNDTWDIPSLAAYPNCAVSVFNRYGARVYNTIGYPKPWDGTYEGMPLPTGVYYYVIDLKNGKNKLSGPLTILK